MMTPSVIKVGTTLTIHMGGRMYTIDQTIKNYDTILDIVKTRKWDDLQEQLDIATLVAKRSNGKAELVDGVVFLDGLPVHQVIAERIIAMFREGWDVEPMLRFLENVSKNPEEYSVQELYLFLETNNLPITEDGHFLAYKVVNRDYMDCHTKTVRNQIGDKPTMKREDVDPNRNNECSRGYHFCSLGYISSFPGDRLMLVKINPADVVSIPRDYNNTKGRCWTYEVVDEIARESREAIDKSAPAVVPMEIMPDKHVPTTTETLLIGILREQLCVSEISLGTPIFSGEEDGLDPDSLDKVEIQMAIEDALNMELPDYMELKTVGDLVRIVEGLIKNREASQSTPAVVQTNLVTEAPSADRYTIFLTIPSPTGSMLKDLREISGITGTALANELGVSRSAVWSFENSLKPKEETVKRVVMALQTLFERRD